VKPYNLYTRTLDYSPEPGQYGPSTQPFGSGVKSFRLGDRNACTPAKGSQGSMSKSRSCFISTPQNLFVPPRKERVPEAGQYQHDLASFGRDAQPITMKQKPRDPLWKPDQNPGPIYSQEKADTVTKPRVIGGNIQTRKINLWHTKDKTPDPGAYQQLELDFTKNSKNITSFNHEQYVSFRTRKPSVEKRQRKTTPSIIIEGERRQRPFTATIKKKAEKRYMSPTNSSSRKIYPPAFAQSDILEETTPQIRLLEQELRNLMEQNSSV